MHQFLSYYLDSSVPFGGASCESLVRSSASTRLEEGKIHKGWRHKARVFTQAHFTCAAAAGTNPERMLRRFCQRMAGHFFLDRAVDAPTDYSSLCSRFRRYCQQAAVSFRGDMSLILVDGLDQLDAALVSASAPLAHSRALKDVDVNELLGNDRGLMPAVEWLPEEVARGGPWDDREGFQGSAQAKFPVRIICSVACDDPGDKGGAAGSKVLKQLRARLAPPYEIFLSEVSAKDRTEVLLSLLASRTRTLGGEVGRGSKLPPRVRRDVGVRAHTPYGVLDDESPASPLSVHSPLSYGTPQKQTRDWHDELVQILSHKGVCPLYLELLSLALGCRTHVPGEAPLPPVWNAGHFHKSVGPEEGKGVEEGEGVEVVRNAETGTNTHLQWVVEELCQVLYMQTVTHCKYTTNTSTHHKYSTNAHMTPPCMRTDASLSGRDGGISLCLCRGWLTWLHSSRSMLAWRTRCVASRLAGGGGVGAHCPDAEHRLWNFGQATTRGSHQAAAARIQSSAACFAMSLVGRSRQGWA